MTEELRIYLKKRQIREVLSFVALLTVLVAGGVGILLLFVPSYYAILPFAVAVFSISYLIYCSRIARRELKETSPAPVVFGASKSFSFGEVVSIFENLTDEEERLSLSPELRFYRLDKVFKLRVVLYRTENFDKKEFELAKARMNKTANKALNISQWVNRFEAGRMMRFNVIFAETMNDGLRQFISRNAAHNLTRVEGIINIAIVGDQIMIPPLYGGYGWAEISRYKGTVKFIEQVF